MLNAPWLPAWSYVGSYGLLWGANVPWYQRVSCTFQLTLPPTLLSLQAIAFTRLLPLMDPSMGPRWCEMAMWGQDIWRANAPWGWDDCTCQSITTHSTCSLPMFGLGAMVIAAVSCLMTSDIGLPVLRAISNLLLSTSPRSPTLSNALSGCTAESYSEPTTLRLTSVANALQRSQRLYCWEIS